MPDGERPQWVDSVSSILGAERRLDFPQRPLESARWASLTGQDRSSQPALHSSRSFRALPNHLVRAQQERLRDRETERFGGLQIDHELKLHRLLDC